ncbi:hypothetical protein [Parageobacillus galactosidasius]|uniref:Helicase/UvrB N-terminal domain-containing protein n=1 Tax=Parageobacillus galactosidasius TaxID=883812 RepID=A0A226QTA0_9BACL|nr:hypothetical protein [Parageobacillus galactosidasius]OXB94639.1 hypothetical protein B9L23_07130 [Parageobacillus galactosidasius]
MLERINRISEVEKFFSNKDHYHNIHEQSFIDVYNVMIDFINESVQLYEEKKQNEEQNVKDNHPYIAKVVNSVMGHGKSTAARIIAKVAHKNNVPLLFVFNNKKNMDSFRKEVQPFVKNELLLIDSDNFNDDLKNIIKNFKIVGITQQRFRDMAIGYGDFSFFSYWKPNIGWIEPMQRTIIIDEMPIFINAESFDIGKNDNCLDWYDEMVKVTNDEELTKFDCERVRVLINYLISMEMAESFKHESEYTSLPTKKLIRHLKDEQRELLYHVLGRLKKEKVEYKYQNRYQWFLKMLENDSVGVVNRDEKKTVILCSKWIEYRHFGNILVLDGTADIVRKIYEHGGYELIELPNYHNYKERLRILFRIINTSKTKRKNIETHESIASDFLEIRERTKDLNIIALPTKADITTYVKNGVITEEQYKKYFSNTTKMEYESMALNLLNTTGQNDLINYNGIGLLALPLRHPTYYKMYAIAIYGVEKDVSLQHENNNGTNSIQWFTDDDVQEIYRQLMLMDFSQIIHRINIRLLNDNQKSYVLIYTNREGWKEELAKLYGLEEIISFDLFRNIKFKNECIERFEHAKTVLEKEPFESQLSLGKFGSRFKKWFNRHWRDEERKKIMIEVAESMNLIVYEYSNGYKKIELVPSLAFGTFRKKKVGQSLSK